jgi:AcrR family transcriptional regulator
MALVMSASAEEGKSDRRARRKIATRKLLINAAIRVFNEKGIDETSVNDITDEADVAYGTFYNYFTSIDELAPQVINAKLNDHIEFVRSMGLKSDDVALLVAVSVSTLAIKIVTDQTMAWLSERPLIMVEELIKTIKNDAKFHRRLGVDQGVFDLPAPSDRVQAFTIWGVTGLLQAALQEPSEAESYADDLTRIYLRLLGLSNEEVEDVLKRRPVIKGAH